MLGNIRKNPEHLGALERIEGWARGRFGLPGEAVILVAEIECRVPGCPPIETVVAFWAKDETRYRFKLFKPVAAVVADDLPISWLLPSLVDYGDLGCECC